MSFAWPLALLGLVLVALALVGYLLVQRRRKKYVVRFTNLDLLENVVEGAPRWRRHVPAALTLAALTALVIGIARPEVAVAVPREEATVVLAMDSSGSMTATDVGPGPHDGRARGREQLRGGPPGRVPGRSRVLLERGGRRRPADRGPRRGRQRAAGARGRQRHRPRRRDRTLGRPRPRRRWTSSRPGATRRRRSSSSSSPTGRTRPATTSRSKRPSRRSTRTCPSTPSRSAPPRGRSRAPTASAARAPIRVPPDPETLAQVAELTGGTFFEAADEEALASVYDEIGSQVGVAHEQRELTVLFTAAGAALLLAGGVLSALWFARIP